MLIAIDLAQVVHQRSEGSLISLEIRGRIGREYVDWLSMWVHDPGKASGVGLYPLGNVVHPAVLPGAKPEQHHIGVMGAGLLHKFVDIREIELPRLRFHLLPIDRRFYGVRMHCLNRWPDFGQRRWPPARIVDLRPENQEWFAVHQECETPILLDEFRHVGRNCRD